MAHRVGRTRYTLIVVAAVLMASNVAQSNDRSWGYRLAGSYSGTNPDGLFFLQPSRGYGLQELFLTYAQDSLYFYGTAYNEAQQGDEPLQKGVINELYLTAKTGEWDVTLGKRRMEWGVGYGFRPLDVIKPVPRRDLIIKTPEGLPMVAFEHYTGNSAVTLLAGNDFQYNDDGYQSGGTEYAARYYALVNGWDVQALIHRRPDVDYEAGAGFSWAANEELELHGSALYQRQYQKWINTLTEQSGTVLASTDPMVLRTFDDGIKGLVGMTYTWRSGHSLLFEYWYDDTGYSAAEWKSLRDLTKTQRALLSSGTVPAVYANIAASTRFLQQPNPMQQNILLRWFFDNGERFVPALDALFTPQDHGAVVTVSATKEVGTAYTLEYGVRHYGGADDSVYRALPVKYVIYGNFKATFDW